ncbi:MAG: sigma-70 family RNA polymerase sigma factor [Gammaproteobacteria bacterium]|nr:sigma-70 family RNA polymerase sigma factor [Gammaproteobacteria bacterium]
MSGTNEITQLLQAASKDRVAEAALINALYGELQVMARGLMRRENAAHTLQPTALANEACMKLLGPDVRWENRAHFFGAAAQAMRRILVDHARARRANKRGGDWARVTFDGVDFADGEVGLDVVEVDELLSALETLDERMVRLVELRFFTGLSVEETAEVMNVSPSTVKRDWRFARAWLREQLGDAG